MAVELGFPPTGKYQTICVFSDLKDRSILQHYLDDDQDHLSALIETKFSAGVLKSSGKRSNGEQQFIVSFVDTSNDSSATKTFDKISKINGIKVVAFVLDLSTVFGTKFVEEYEVRDWEKITTSVFDVGIPKKAKKVVAKKEDKAAMAKAFENAVTKIVKGKKEAVKTPPPEEESSESDVESEPQHSEEEVGEETTLLSTPEEVPEVQPTQEVTGDSGLYQWFFTSMMATGLFNEENLRKQYSLISKYHDIRKEVTQQRSDEHSDVPVEEPHTEETHLQEEDESSQQEDDDKTVDDEEDVDISWDNTTIKELIDLTTDSLSSYKKVFDTMEDTIEEISAFHEKEAKAGNTILPPLMDVFAALERTPLENVKCLVLSQDPYHTLGVAMGMCFSQHPSKKTIQPSLQIIKKALKYDGFTQGENGDLSKWADEGVLLLNTCLTVRQGEAASYAEKTKGKGDGIWKDFIDYLLGYLNKKVPHLVVILWGSHAQKYRKVFDTKKHHIIECIHPAASIYGKENATKFIEHKPFSRANAALKGWKMDPVDWNL